MNEPSTSARPATLCVHAGTHLDPATRGVCSPIFTSTAYQYPNAAHENVYPRYFNVPNQRVIAAKLAALEHAEEGLVFGSGMAAISTVFFAHLKPGDHAVLQADLYGGTFHFLTGELSRYGVEFSFVRDPGSLASAIRANTRLVYVESPSNPLLRCLDLAAVASAARGRGIPTVIDNTFATPINQNPIDHGIDIVVHSGTKYLNGHSDVNCGAAVGSRETIQRVAEYAVNHGGTLDAHACYLLERGLKTLALRVGAQNHNADLLSRFLQSHPAVARVHYPGLPDDPDHAVAARQMRGFGGMLSFELRAPDQVDQVLRRLRLITPALSLGGVETLICVPSRTSHVKMTRAEREHAGISEQLLRLSVGIEDADDLVADLKGALENGGRRETGA